MPALLRWVLGFQSAGVQRVWIPGASAEQIDELRADKRASNLEVVHEASELHSAPRAWVVSTALTVHRAWFAWACGRDVPAQIESLGEPRLLHVPGESLPGLIEQLSAQGGSDAIALPLASSQIDLPGPMFALPATDAAERRAAVRPHLRSLIKATGGVIDRHVMRPVSLQITRALMNRAVSPNVVTVVTLILSFVAAALVASTHASIYIGGAVLHFWVRIFDCVDGELARLRYESSPFGQWLDTVGDGLGVAALVAAVTYKSAPLGPLWVWVGAVGVFLYLCVQVLQLRIAKRQTGGGSLQAVDWAFHSSEARGIDRFVGAIHNFVRIDFISTAYAVLVIFDLSRVLLVAHLAASTGGAAYLLGQALSAKKKVHGP